jgi:hypothetical protein
MFARSRYANLFEYTTLESIGAFSLGLAAGTQLADRIDTQMMHRTLVDRRTGNLNIAAIGGVRVTPGIEVTIVTVRTGIDNK